MPEPFRKKVSLAANTPITLMEAAVVAGYQGNPLCDEYRIITTDQSVYIGTSKATVNTLDSDSLPANGATDTERAGQSKIDLNKIVFLVTADTKLSVRIRP